ncbi:Heat shock 70 kDa protein 16 [Hibiscus syriacus]|uniref:Heat shock 70 kDa protein 16 n=1 Tax=Hibiscus syriacus TaxID=106335 RepID=A0A6A3C678_HIBSY|nr:Heat shock 70 kDa protein 16 [Hibiscus syriacus]
MIQHKCRPASLSHWIKPPQDTLKINVYEACVAVVGAVTVGVLDRDFRDMVIAGHTQSVLDLLKTSLEEQALIGTVCHALIYKRPNIFPFDRKRFMLPFHFYSLILRDVSYVVDFSISIQKAKQSLIQFSAEKISVVGFDIGNENCVIAVAKQRGTTPAVVSLGEKQRFMGSAGAASATMNPRSTILQVKKLIGRKFNESDLEKELKLFPFGTFESPDGGISIWLQFMGEVHEFTPVQILGVLLSHLKQIAEKNLEMPFLDCVIGIPSYFTDLQRRAYLDAAVIAGLKPLRLLHDCTATALGYGIYKTDFSNSGPVYSVFVDIGHCDTQVRVASFETGPMKIISHAFDRSLGGRDFDEVLFNHFASQFQEQYNIDVHTNIKASVRLRASCEKLKKVLSANAEAPLNIEYLMDEKDVRGLIKREEFENLSSDLLERITVPCRKVLADSGLTLDKINSVELVESGSRILAITRI